MIAFLGWGSLVWDPRTLPIHRHWHSDGPFVRAEFLRESKDRRLTLVLSDTVEPVRSLWSTFSGVGLQEARQALVRREGATVGDIGVWSRGEPNPAGILELEQWASARSIKSVVWTALPAKFGGQSGVSPTVDEAVFHLGELTGSTRDVAEQYVRRTPAQIDTYYRRRIEAELGWLQA